jgi:hypothetical protein
VEVALGYRRITEATFSGRVLPHGELSRGFGFSKKIFKPKPEAPCRMNLGLVLSESPRFSKEPEPGLELLDILTIATR